MGKTIERISGIRVITVAFYDEEDEKGRMGYIDFVDGRFGKPSHRFAFVARKDWEREVIIPNDGNLGAYGGKKTIESQLGTIEVILEVALMNDNKMDIVVERRQVSEKQQFDFLVKVDSVTAFQG